MIRFWVEGTPKAQPRSRRSFMRHGAPLVFDPGTAEGWKGEIALAARELRPAAPHDGPVELVLHFFMPRPKSHSGAKGLKPTAPHEHTSKPDFDNLAKAVCDALTRLGFWRDDGQVWRSMVEKVYVPAGQRVGLEIIVHLDERPTPTA